MALDRFEKLKKSLNDRFAGHQIEYVQFIGLNDFSQRYKLIVDGREVENLAFNLELLDDLFVTFLNADRNASDEELIERCNNECLTIIGNRILKHLKGA